MTRGRKSSIKPEEARKWLQLYEEYGSSMADIAESVHYDIRTVRRHIEEARQERDRREARRAFLRGALEKHHADLVRLAKKLLGDVSGDVPEPVARDMESNRLWAALRGHIPRSILWDSLKKWQQLEESYQQALIKLKARAKQEAPGATSLEFVTTADEHGIDEGMVEALVYHLQQLASGDSVLARTEVRELDDPKGCVIQHHIFRIGLVPREQATELISAYRGLLGKAEEWEESEVFMETVRRFRRLQRELREELETITLRRVLPGRCRYCPF